MANTPDTRKLLALQHNCARGGQVLEAVLESAVRMGADLVLIQEPRGEREKDSTRSHPSFTFIRGAEGEPAFCWIAVNRASRCRVTELKDMTRNCKNHVQVIEVTPPGRPAITIANVYDQWREGGRPAQRADWGAIAKSARVIIAGDMNAHSTVWNGRATGRKNAVFWEKLIEEEVLMVWNTEEATRLGGPNHSIIDLTLSSPNVELNWSIGGEKYATGSDHEVIVWEVLGQGTVGGVSKDTTGWDISGWTTAGKEGEKLKAAEKKRVEAREVYLRAAGRTPLLSEESTVEEVDAAAAGLKEAMTGTLNKLAKKKRWCPRSKRWWSEDVKELRRELGAARREFRNRPAGISRFKEARRNFRRGVRRAKRECWNRFLQEGKGNDVWTATRYTTPRIDKAGQALVDEDGNIAEGHYEREKALLSAHFPKAPPGDYTPKGGGRAFERVNTEVVGGLLGKAANASAPGDDRISAGILKVFWEWDHQRIVQLVRACIRLGHHPELWKTAKGIVIPKPGKPDYSRVRAYRVICLLDVISKLVERTAGYLIGDHLERKKGLHEGQYGCRKRRSCIDAVAVIMNRSQQAWGEKKIAGALFMDVKAAFNNVSRAHLGKRMEALELEPDLIRWTDCFMTGRQVKLVLDGEIGDASPVDTGIPQGSPAAPILFVTYLSGIFDEVERAVPGIKGLSFADDVGWWAKADSEDEVAAKLAEAAAAALDWAKNNGVAFDQGKTEAVLFRQKKTAPTATVWVGTSNIPFNTEATRWLGVWLDSQLTLKEHHAIRLKEGKKAMGRLRRLTGQMGLSPVNCRKVMTACVQSVAMFGSELWWKGDGVEGTKGRAEELQVAVNQQARAVTGCFGTTNRGALAMESGLRPAMAQLENRQRRFGLRLLSLPEGDQAREVVGATSRIGKRLKNALAHRGGTETTVLLEDPEPLGAKTIQADEKEAKAEAERIRPGLTMFTDGSRLDSEAAGYAVVWRSGQVWAGVKNHMGHNQEAYDAECAALARALEEAAKRQVAPERVTIFTDAQAAIRRMISEEPGPGQKYAIQARRHIATLRRARPEIVIEIRWCPAHKGVPGNEKADEWAKAAAEKPDGRGGERLPRSLAHIKREISEKKWAEARQWAGGRVTRKKYKMPAKQKPDGTVAGSSKRLASRFYQLKTGHCLTGQHLNWTKNRPTPQCWWCASETQTRDHLFKECAEWRDQQKILWAEVKKETGRWKSRWKVRDLLADERCSKPVLDFLSTTDVGRLAPALADEDAQSEVSEWELRERREREEERGAEAERLGAEVEEPLFLPTPAFMASAEEE